MLDFVPEEPGEVRCLKCQELFLSPDRRRICRCKERKERTESGLRVVSAARLRGALREGRGVIEVDPRKGRWPRGKHNR